MGIACFELEVAGPFRLDLVVWALRRRAHNDVDAWDGTTYDRVLSTTAGSFEVAVRQPTKEVGVLGVAVRRSGTTPGGTVQSDVGHLLRRMLGLDVDLRPFYAMAERDPRLAPLARRFVGLRPPRFPSVFEALVNAVACQQLSLEVGIHLLNRLAARYGLRLKGTVPRFGFPGPDRLAEADPAELRKLGFSHAKSRVLVGLAQRATAGTVDLDALAGLDDEAVRSSLMALPGIGRWSAEYAMLRGLGRLHVLPGDDVGARNNLRRRFGLPEGADYEAVAELARDWWPFAGVVYFHLLLDGLAGARLVSGSGEEADSTAWPGGIVRRRRRTW